MNTEIKNTVKNLFSTLKFEDALEATRNLRGEYIAEYGVKSWNGLVSYYKKANIQPEAVKVAEPEPTYTATSKDESSETVNTENSENDEEITMMNITPENVGDLHNTLGGIFGEDQESTCKESTPRVSKTKAGKKDEMKPLMKQYEEMKKKHPDAILLFRVGDFYETFCKDAVEVSEVLGITLTKRMDNKANPIELTGFPHHALNTYLPKLTQAGKRVAICEQLEDPKKATVKEVVEPATQLEDAQKELTEPAPDADKESEEEERVEYMLYQNDGDRIDWYGHFVNYKGLKVGETAMMVRMNNLGVGMGKVIATSSMTMNEIGMFHKCYAFIRQSYSSDNKRVEMFKKAFNNLQSAMRDPKFSTLSKSKEIANFVLNHKKED